MTTEQFNQIMGALQVIRDTSISIERHLWALGIGIGLLVMVQFGHLGYVMVRRK